MDARGGLSWAASASISVSSAREQSCRVMVRLGTGAGARLWVNCSYAYCLCSYADSSYRNSGGPARV
jgi:hypothetical protein